MLMKIRSKKAFTLVEIMIVVAIIGLLAAIAIPNFVKARRQARKNICISNMRTIFHAMEQYTIDENVAEDYALSDSAGPIFGAAAYIKEAPVCPEGSGAYTALSTGNEPLCPNSATYTDHVLP